MVVVRNNYNILFKAPQMAPDTWHLQSLQFEVTSLNSGQLLP